jgi:transcriptional regulator with XRE-family HTH domain
MMRVSAKKPKRTGRPRTMTYGPFGQRLAAKLSERGWTRKTLEEKTGVNQKSIWRWMAGKNRPDHDAVAAIAKVLACSPSWLLWGKAA